MNRFLEVCPFCGEDPGGDRSDSPLVTETPESRRSPGRYRPIQPVAVFVQLMFGLFVIGSIVAITTAWSYRGALLDLAADRPILFEDAVLAEDRYRTAAGLVGGANLLLAIAFVVWFWRAYSNLTVLGRPRKRRAGWAIGAWFVPIGNFFIPYGIGAEIWTQSKVADSGSPGSETNLEPVISWWALFLIMGLVNQIAFFAGNDGSNDPAQIASIVGLDLLGSVIAVAGAIAAIRFVRFATARQQALAATVLGPGF